MNLDHRLITLRSRRFPGICDLSLQLVRACPGVLLGGLLLGAVPLAVLNHLVAGFVSGASGGGSADPAAGWLHLGLVVLESQLGTVFVTAWLGRAMFAGKSGLWAAVQDVWQRLLPLLWVSLVLRPVGPLLAAFCVWLAWGAGAGEGSGAVRWMQVFGLIALVVRLMRPFAVEIVVLEKTPLLDIGGRADVVGYSRRSRNLHHFAPGTVFARSLASAAVLGPLLLSVYGSWLFLDQAFSVGLGQSPAACQILWVISLWMVAGYAAVVRFVSYVDLRVRQEGWDTELRIRSEAMRYATP